MEIESLYGVLNRNAIVFQKLIFKVTTSFPSLEKGVKGLDTCLENLVLIDFFKKSHCQQKGV